MLDLRSKMFKSIDSVSRIQYLILLNKYFLLNQNKMKLYLSIEIIKVAMRHAF